MRGIRISPLEGSTERRAGSRERCKFCDPSCPCIDDFRSSGAGGRVSLLTGSVNQGPGPAIALTPLPVLMRWHDVGYVLTFMEQGDDGRQMSIFFC